MTYRTRFAPSPTGLLHLGHAYSALLAYDHALAHNGAFLLRIEDLDTSRCRPEFEEAIFEDLAWLGIRWEPEVVHQTQRHEAYQGALHRLIDLGLCYPCSCTRGDIRAAISAPQEGEQPQMTPDGILYPGTCRNRSMIERKPSDAIRLDMARAIAYLGEVSDLSFSESGPSHQGRHHLVSSDLISKVGDIVLARRDIGNAAYHLSVVVDDAAQGITNITRGEDLFEATIIHRLLQALLELPTPNYHHHRLIRDENGKRLAKRHDSKAIRKFRTEGATPKDIRQMVGLS